jgi:hypothetical protein
MSVESYYFLHDGTWQELGTYMMQIVDGRFTLHIMNRHPPSHLNTVDSVSPSAKIAYLEILVLSIP